MKTYELIRGKVTQKIETTGKTQAILAAEIGYSPARLSQIINGRCPIHDEDITKLCNYFQCTPNDLIPYSIFDPDPPERIA